MYPFEVIASRIVGLSPRSAKVVSPIGFGHSSTVVGVTSGSKVSFVGVLIKKMKIIKKMRKCNFDDKKISTLEKFLFITKKMFLFGNCIIKRNKRFLLTRNVEQRNMLFFKNL